MVALDVGVVVHGGNARSAVVLRTSRWGSSVTLTGGWRWLHVSQRLSLCIWSIILLRHILGLGVACRNHRRIRAVERVVVVVGSLDILVAACNGQCHCPAHMGNQLTDSRSGVGSLEVVLHNLAVVAEVVDHSHKDLSSVEGIGAAALDPGTKTC